MHYLLKQLVPPIFKTLRWYSFKYGWKGNYATYSDAQKNTTSYAADHILQKIITTTTKVKNKEIVYERDGIAYDKLLHNFPMLSTLLFIASQNDSELTIIDFGGSLGTTYYQNKPYLSNLKKLTWCIIEQPNYVQAGKENFENDELKFYYNLEDCLKENTPQLVMFCGVIQYIESYKAVVESIASYKIPYLLIDYIAYNSGKHDRYAIQHVPPVFYGAPASYACIFFGKDKFYALLQQHYKLVFDYIADNDEYYLQLQPFKYEGVLWKLK